MNFDQIYSLYENELWSNLIRLAPFFLSPGNFEEYTVCDRQQILLIFADSYLEVKQWRKAEALYKDALQLKKQIKPNSRKTSALGDLSDGSQNSQKIQISEAEIKYKIHLCYVNTGQIGQAVNILKSIPVKQRTAKTSMALGKLYQRASLERPAVGCYREVLKNCPLALDAARGLMDLGVKGMEIQELTLEATSGSPGMEWYVTWIQAYAAFANRNDYSSALALLKQLENHPVCKNNVEILATLATCQYYKGDDTAALITLQRIHSLDPTYLSGMDILAGLLAKERRIKELEELATQLMSVTEDAPEPWIAMGYYCYAIKKGSRSLFFAHKACMLDRRNVEALVLKGNILLDVKKLKDAMDHFREAVTLAPHRYETHKGMVDCYLAQSRHREAVSVATSSCKQLNNSPRALTLYARVLSKDPLQLSASKAKNLLEKALAIDCNHLPAAFMLAEILEQESNLAQAVKLLKSQLSVKSTTKIHTKLGDLFVKLNEEEEALEHYRKALNLDPKNPAALEGLHMIEHSTDNTHDGVAGSAPLPIAGNLNYDDMEMEDLNSDAEEEEEAEADLEESETEAVWSDADLNVSINNY